MVLFDNLSYCFVIYMSILNKIEGFFLLSREKFPCPVAYARFDFDGRETFSSDGA